MSHEEGSIDRRLLLGAAGLAGFAALSRLASAGPITPPVGAVGSTGRTLDEIYNKIPGANGSGDGRIPIPGGAAVNITQPGSYVLTGNITGTTGALSISGSDIAVDLNGYTVSCTLNTGFPVFIAGTGSRVIVRNGTVVGGQYGVSVGAASAPIDILAEDLVCLNQRLRGISLSVGGIDRTRARRCSVYGCGSTTTSADASQQLIGILVGGNNARVEDCSVGGMSSNATGTSYYGIQAGGTGGCLVSGCGVSNATLLTPATGIYMFGSGVRRNNTVMNFVTAYTGGTDGTGNVSA